MADIVERINELKALSAEQHLFCPRTGIDDASLYFPEDIAADPNADQDPATVRERDSKIEQTEERKWVALEAMQILAFDGEEAVPYKQWIQERMDSLMTSCDVCVRVFHQTRKEWQQKLLEHFDEEHVDAFLQTVDAQSLGRIQRGLGEAHEVLRAADPKQRGVRILPSEAVYAIFEALSCDAMIRNEDLLQQHFDAPFELVQTKKRLKLQTFVPAMTRFLFTQNHHRQMWASQSWSTVKRAVLSSEFDWTVREHLENAMMRVQMTNLDLPFVSTYWAGVRLIVNKMDKELISTSLPSLEGKFYELMLEHLSLHSEAFLDLVETMQIILKKSPTDFWVGVNTVTPSTVTVVEQVFNSPVLKQMLLAVSEENEEDIGRLNRAFAWMTPFLASIQPKLLPKVISACADGFLDRFQADNYSRTARSYCFKEGLRVLDYAFRKMCEGKSENSFVGQPVVNSILDILSSYIQLIVGSLNRLKAPEMQEDRGLLLSTIQHAFALEATSLNIEKQLIEGKKPSPTQTPSSSPIWSTVLTAIDPETFDLATHLLLSGRNLIGLEPCLWKPGFDNVPATVKHFNSRFELLSKSITDIVDRMTEFSPEQLNDLFKQPAAASSIVSLLFSSTEDTRSSAIELLKVITYQDERRNALQEILTMHYKNVLIGISDSCRQVARKRIFAPASNMIRSCSDLIDVLCNSSDGILRSRQLDTAEAGATMNFWKNMWNMLTMFFATTEAWSNLGVYDKMMMMDFCRDVMQFADDLFDQCSVFASALKPSPQGDEDTPNNNELMGELLQLPARTMMEAKKWLRLRDEYLSSKSVTLIGKLLVRLRAVSVDLDEETLSFITEIVLGKIRTKLTAPQQAELQQAIEAHIGRPIVEEQPIKQERQVSINRYMGGDSVKEPPTASEARAKLMQTLTPTASAFRENREFLRMKQEKAAKQAKVAEAKNASQAEFKRKRQLELERQKQEKEAAIAKARKERGLTSATAEAGSALSGLGVLDRDSAPKGEGLMQSSDESDDEGDIDMELFGISKKPSAIKAKTNIINDVKVPMPVKKRRVQRSINDMRARLAPNLSPLYETILGWNYFHDGVWPPNSKEGDYAGVPRTFRTVKDYQKTFGALLMLEAWQSFVNTRREGEGKPYQIDVTQRSTVDSFMEIGTTMTREEDRIVQASVGDIVLLSKTNKPSPGEPHCLARIFLKKPKNGFIEVSYRVMPRSNPMATSLNPKSKIFGIKIQSITPLEREYAALYGLQYYDLCDEIINAKPSPLLSYSDVQLEPLMKNFMLNKAQAKAVKSAFDNDAFTLIQGPPGSGKTKTITAIVGALLSDSLRKRGKPMPMPGQSTNPTLASNHKRLLVCAPSNAAVDELVMRFKNGIKSLDGQQHKVNIVRLGRSDAMSDSVKDVTLEELVAKKLGANTTNGKDPDAMHKLFEKHKNISAQVIEVRQQKESGEFKGDAFQKLEKDFQDLKRLKAHLSKQIDDAKDEQSRANRNESIVRRQAQEGILRDAHIVCATLSGSGHDMFQQMSVDFETVIVDEAAQCVELSALIPLKYGCAKTILVGDPKQLPPTVFSEEAKDLQYERSLFVRMQENHQHDVHLLDTQYRMHPEISFFPSWTFYDGKLVNGGDMAALTKQPWHKSWLLGPYRFFDIQGQHQYQGHSLVNNNEVEVALRLYARLRKDYPKYDFHGKVGIITPYKSQLSLLRSTFSREYGAQITEAIMFNTTDAFQGREAEVIIFSCVRAAPGGGVGFLKDIRRMNVGLTRAKSSLWVLGNSQSLMRGKFWRKLIEDAQRRQRFTDGNVMQMLKMHSNEFPAKPGMFDEDVPVPMDLVRESRESKPMKVEVNGSRKRSRESSGDVEMSDADADDSPATLELNSTPGPALASSPMPEPTESVERQKLPQRMKKKPRQAPNPLVPSKPRK